MVGEEIFVEGGGKGRPRTNILSRSTEDNEMNNLTAFNILVLLVCLTCHLALRAKPETKLNASLKAIFVLPT